MHSFVRNLITEWRRLSLPFADATVIVAVSGGADSVSLLLAIDDLRKRKKLDLRVVVAHFDHNLRADSDADLVFVRELTSKRKFELVHEKWNHPGGNIEQTARDARYDFLSRTAEKLNASYVLTAHTMNDQAETVLMNLIRGSGPEGLGGMKAVRLMEEENSIDREGETDPDPFLPFSLSPVYLSRPLLGWAKRRDTEGFCRENEIEFRTDAMNEDLNFRRVWVRKVLIPMIEEMNPKIIETLCHTARLLPPKSESGAVATGPGSEMKKSDGTSYLSIARMIALEKGELYAELRSWLRQNRGNLRGIGLKHIEGIERLIHSRKSGRVAELPGGAVVKHAGRLEWQPGKAEKG